jgi:hypothetical protein
MNRDLVNLARYCLDILGVQPWTKPWKDAAMLPYFLRQDYDFYQLKLMDLNCLLAIDKRKEERPPATIQKQLAHVLNKGNQPVIYLRRTVTSYNRQRLVKHKMPFVIPGNQMYLPMLGMDLRERFHPAEKQKPTLDPSTQLLLLYVLNSRKEGPLTPGRMAKALQYSPMTMTRAFAQLELMGIGEHVVRAKDRRVIFPEDRRLLWEQIAPYARSPVRKALYLERRSVPGKLPVAGLTALERHSMISAPRIPVYASGVRAWSQVKSTAKIVPFDEEATVQVELWTYKPEVLAKNGSVDHLSLYLSLRADPDERVAAAIKTMLAKFPW